jgi:hypothetical protein
LPAGGDFLAGQGDFGRSRWMQTALAAVAVTNPGRPLSHIEQTLAAFGWVTGLADSGQVMAAPPTDRSWDATATRGDGLIVRSGSASDAKDFPSCDSPEVTLPVCGVHFRWRNCPVELVAAVHIASYTHLCRTCRWRGCGAGAFGGPLGPLGPGAAIGQSRGGTTMAGETVATIVAGMWQRGEVAESDAIARLLSGLAQRWEQLCCSEVGARSPSSAARALQVT